MNSEIMKRAAETYGTPLYVFEEDRFADHYLELDGAYKSVYPKFQIAYSFKTNYMPAVCRRVLTLGGWAEVVSDMEYHLAKRYGFPPERIIVNGPGKWNGMEEMILDGAFLMLDNRFEYERSAAIARKNNLTAKIGFRLNMDIGTNKNSRFGFDVTDPETEALIRAAREDGHMEIIGLHFHLGGARNLQAWQTRAEKMLHYAGTLLEDSERTIIDLGSGMFGHMHPAFAQQFHQQIPSFREYAQTVAGLFAQAYGSLPEEKRPTLIVEPGTTVVADTMVYAVSVIATKCVRGRNIAMVDGSVHQLGELGKKKRLPVEVLYREAQTKRLPLADITGYTCLEDDILYPGLEQPVGQGDLLWFQNAGAYTNVMKPPFIQVGCKIVSCRNDGTMSLVKREETTEDILASYIID